MMDPNYYGILPARIRYDKRLKPMEKIMYAEITALANNKGYCYASNGYFSDLYEVHKVTVSNWIGNLVEFGYLTNQIIYKEDSLEIKERRLYINDVPFNENINTYKEKNIEGINKKINTPISENTKDNNINNNIININNNSLIRNEIRLLIGDKKLNIDKIIKLNKSIERIKEVFEYCEKNKKGEGYIMDALKNDYNLAAPIKKQEKIVHSENEWW